MKKALLILFIFSFLIGNAQYYIGEKVEDVIGAIQKDAVKISKNYTDDGKLKLSWIEPAGHTGYNVFFIDNVSYTTFIIPLNASTLKQWISMMNKNFSKSSSEENVWISYTKTGTFKIEFVHYEGTNSDCFRVTKTEEY